ncbi:hypothetical protein [Fictibacillus barbaricus]|uniref:hypothetical protein n=1 Tax=Fictibacillus barbaricus TaxID=182136 RepID=UPI0019A30E48|nr:hypothetical protein [Fictibacillus barbaricus]GGB55614.1 hypothetical protein GCM10007199_21870 [Fictibacillus barbaricus]
MADGKEVSKQHFIRDNGDAKKALSIRPGETPLDTEYYPNLSRSNADDGLIRIENTQSICTTMYLKGKDFFLPYIEVLEKENKAYVKGTAMFHHDKMVWNIR